MGAWGCLPSHIALLTTTTTFVLAGGKNQVTTLKAYLSYIEEKIKTVFKSHVLPFSCPLHVSSCPTDCDHVVLSEARTKTMAAIKER